MVKRVSIYPNHPYQNSNILFCQELNDIFSFCVYIFISIECKKWNVLFGIMGKKRLWKSWREKKIVSWFERSILNGLVSNLGRVKERASERARGRENHFLWKLPTKLKLMIRCTKSWIAKCKLSREMKYFRFQNLFKITKFFAIVIRRRIGGRSCSRSISFELPIIVVWHWIWKYFGGSIIVQLQMHKKRISAGIFRIGVPDEKRTKRKYLNGTSSNMVLG